MHIPGATAVDASLDTSIMQAFFTFGDVVSSGQDAVLQAVEETLQAHHLTEEAVEADELTNGQVTELLSKLLRQTTEAPEQQQQQREQQQELLELQPEQKEEQPCLIQTWIEDPSQEPCWTEAWLEAPSVSTTAFPETPLSSTATVHATTAMQSPMCAAFTLSAQRARGLLGKWRHMLREMSPQRALRDMSPTKNGTLPTNPLIPENLTPKAALRKLVMLGNALDRAQDALNLAVTEALKSHACAKDGQNAIAAGPRSSIMQAGGVTNKRTALPLVAHLRQENRRRRIYGKRTSEQLGVLAWAETAAGMPQVSCRSQQHQQKQHLKQKQKPKRRVRRPRWKARALRFLYPKLRSRRLRPKLKPAGKRPCWQIQFLTNFLKHAKKK